MFQEFRNVFLDVLNYCNFKEYYKYILLVVPDAPIGRITCISLYLDVPIERITKSYEEVPSIVSRVISTLVVVIQAYITKLGLLEPT